LVAASQARIAQAAARLGLSRFQLYTRLKRYQIAVQPGGD
jgi:transcriptional regulator of acetoin/glycerol metabolism